MLAKNAGVATERDLQLASELSCLERIEKPEDFGSWLSSRKLRGPDYMSLVEHDERVARLRRRRETGLSLAILLLLRERGLLDRYINR